MTSSQSPTTQPEPPAEGSPPSVGTLADASLDVDVEKATAQVEESRTSTAHPDYTPPPSKPHGGHLLTRQQSRLYSTRGEVPIELLGAVLEETDAFRVFFDGPDDPRNAQNWPFRKKALNVVLMTIATMFAGIGTALMSGTTPSIMNKFHVNQTVAEFTNGIHLVAMAFGPMIFGPFSEVFGRKWPCVAGVFISSCFHLMTAAAPNLVTVFFGRFLSGLFGCAPYAIGGGFFHDIFDALHVQGGIAFFAVATAGGPAWGPVIGAGLSTTGPYGWRWANWLMAAFGLAVSISLALFLTEPYSPVILKHAAQQKRRATGNYAWHSELDTVVITPKDLVARYLLRPLKMLFTEPMLIVITVYLSFVYSLLYMLMAALPVIYSEYRGMSSFVGTLPLISVFIGILFGGAAIFLDMGRYGKLLGASDEESLPEERFVPMGCGGVLLFVGLFWFAFTGPAQTSSPWPSIIALAVCMAGCVLVFECGIIYIIDMYRSFANSAIAANGFARCFAAATFPLFTPALVHNLGYKGSWGMALLAFLALALSPIPLVFYHIGGRLRAKSKFSDEL